MKPLFGGKPPDGEDDASDEDLRMVCWSAHALSRMNHVRTLKSARLQRDTAACVEMHREREAKEAEKGVGLTLAQSRKGYRAPQETTYDSDNAPFSPKR
jgi:hypothetical protein